MKSSHIFGGIFWIFPQNFGIFGIFGILEFSEFLEFFGILAWDFRGVRRIF